MRPISPSDTPAIAEASAVIVRYLVSSLPGAIPAAVALAAIVAASPSPYAVPVTDSSADDIIVDTPSASCPRPRSLPCAVSIAVMRSQPLVRTAPKPAAPPAMPTTCFIVTPRPENLVFTWSATDAVSASFWRGWSDTCMFLPDADALSSDVAVLPAEVAVSSSLRRASFDTSSRLPDSEAFDSPSSSFVADLAASSILRFGSSDTFSFAPDWPALDMASSNLPADLAASSIAVLAAVSFCSNEPSMSMRATRRPTSRATGGLLHARGEGCYRADGSRSAMIAACSRVAGSLMMADMRTLNHRHVRSARMPDSTSTPNTWCMSASSDTQLSRIWGHVIGSASSSSCAGGRYQSRSPVSGLYGPPPGSSAPYAPGRGSYGP